MQLRPYQDKAVAGVRMALKDGFRAPLLVSPTGSGKTVIFSYICKSAVDKGNRAYVLTHRVELLRQTSAALRQFGVRHGLVNPNYRPNPLASVQVCTVQTLVNRLGRYAAPDLIIIDECHHATAGQYKVIISAYPKAVILGVTATPVRGDGKGLGVESGGVFDTIVYGPSVRELVDLGYLVRPRVFGPANKVDLSQVHTRMGEYRSDELYDVMRKPSVTGDAIVEWERRAVGLPTVVFCVRVEHAMEVAQAFRDRGYRAEHVEGAMNDSDRQRILGGLADGSVDVVTSVDLISEGTDIPAIGCAILLRPTQSESLYLQQIGRAMRPYKGRTEAIVLDHAGNTLAHGSPMVNRDWSLDGVEKRNGKSRKNEDKAQQCKACFTIFDPQPVCPVCGHEQPRKKHELRKVEGELVELTDEVKGVRRAQQAQAKSLQELQQIARERNYRPGWAYKVWQSRNKNA